VWCSGGKAEVEYVCCAVLVCVVLVCEEPLVQIFGNVVCISVCWHVIFELE
jgi:hypothetical protein